MPRNDRNPVREPNSGTYRMPSFLESSPAIERTRDVTPFSSFRTKASARYFLEIRSEADLDALSDAMSEARSKNLPVVFVS